MNARQVAILGCGRIGEALLSGLLSSGWREPSEVVVTDRRDERLAELRERHGAEATSDNAAAVEGAAVAVVAVKPQDIDVLLAEIGPHLRTEQTVVSVAAACDLEDGVVRDARIALGGVAHKPWRAERAEAALRGVPATEESFAAAADAELAEARPLRDNGFKVPLARNAIVRSLAELCAA